MVHDFIKFDSSNKQFLCRGDWTLHNLVLLQSELQHQLIPVTANVIINGKDIKKMDSAGALQLIKWIKKLTKKNIKIQLKDFSQQHQDLLPIIEKISHQEMRLPDKKRSTFAETLGKKTIAMVTEFRDFLAFTGKLAYESIRVLPFPRRWRWNSLTHVIDTMGVQALPIIGLLAFMIGIVTAYQISLQLRNYGANIFIVDFIGFSILREFGPLMTAIILSGRTGAAYTAQLGTMKINEEIDALNTMGVTPDELLLLPRIFGLLIVLPLLTIWADALGVLGGMIMANNMLNITWVDFLHRFQHEIPVRALLIGLGKAPIFALIIASIGCFEGMQVQKSADSIGRNTTRSVVLAIFFIIVADSIFSIIFSKLKL